jgi:hypothetical protein
MLLESNDDETRAVVALLMEKSERLSDAAKESDVLFSLAQRIGSVPGLGVISCKEVDRDTRDEAIQMADSAMSALETVDRFVSLHARTIKVLLESRTEISAAFEDALMGRVASHETGIQSTLCSILNKRSMTVTTSNSRFCRLLWLCPLKPKRHPIPIYQWQDLPSFRNQRKMSSIFLVFSICWMPMDELLS